MSKDQVPSLTGSKFLDVKSELAEEDMTKVIKQAVSNSNASQKLVLEPV